MVVAETGERCEECGNHSIVRLSQAGRAVYECSLCGHLSGDGDAVEFMEDLREADVLGIDPDIYPLRKQLDAIRGVRSFEGFGGDPEVLAMPYVQFNLNGDEMEWLLERLMTSLEMMRRDTAAVWHVEILFRDHQVAFSLKPKRPRDGRPLDSAWINATRGDVDVIARGLRTHLKLSFWQR